MKQNQEISRIVLIYAIFGCTWIYFSDTALGWFVHNPEVLTKWSLFKGLLFIGTTSVLLYFLIARLSANNKLSKDALRASEERLHFLVKNSSDSLVIVNADGSQRYVSPAAERITGFPITELEGRSLDTLIHPEDLQGITAAWNEAIEHPDKTVTVQYRHIHKTREWVFSEAIAQSFLNEPAINGVIASVRDITERKQAEEVIARQDALLRAILRNLPFDFWARDTRQNIIMQSDQSVLFWGDLALDPQSDGPFDAQTAKRWSSNNSRVLEGEMISEDCAFVTKSGEQREFHQIVAPIREGEAILGILGINIDITEHQRAVEELRRSNELLASFIKHSPIYAYIKEVDPTESRVLKASENYQDMIGIPGSQMAGKTMQQLFPAEFAAKITADDWLVVSRGEIYCQDEELNDRYYTTIKFPILLEGKNFLAGYTIDLTERKRAEEEKKNLEQQLAQAQKMESVGRLAGGVAHDFNNMLGVILGHTELAMNQLDATHPLFSGLKNIRKAAERSADLTRQLLTFARKQTVTPKVLDLNETVEVILNMLMRLIGENIDLVWLPGENLGAVKMDPSQIDQVLANLCVNARDAIGNTGKVTIATDVAAFDEAYCAAHASVIPGEYLVLTVSDNGCGMDPETLAHLFEPFYTTKEMGKGTGLGLATVYGIVKQNNGFINVDSAPGQGATFRIYLPRHATKAEKMAKTDAGEPVARGRETILLVEDEPMILEMTMEILKSLGYSILPAATPGEAICLAREHAGSIHLLMTDVVMPEMNGRDLAKKLLSLYPNLKRLFMSGYTADVIAHHGVLDEGVHFIQKPFTVKDLAAKIREVLD